MARSRPLVAKNMPSLPDVEIDPSLVGVKGAPCCSMKVYYGVAILLGLVVAAICGFMAFSDADDSITSQLFDLLQTIP